MLTGVDARLASKAANSMPCAGAGQNVCVSQLLDPPIAN